MEQLLPIEFAQDMSNIDIGGTPAKVLENDKISHLEKLNMSSEQTLAILDPFDSSRSERSIAISNTGRFQKIKVPLLKNFPIETPSDFIQPGKLTKVYESFSMQKERICSQLYQKYPFLKKKREEILQRYNQFLDRLEIICKDSPNIRDLMDSVLLELLPPKSNCRRLESVLEGNHLVTLEILREREMKTRIFCSGCKKIIPVTMNFQDKNKEICEHLNFLEAVHKGTYIPDGSTLTAILFCSGINPLLNIHSPYLTDTIQVLKKLGRLDRPVLSTDICRRSE